MNKPQKKNLFSPYPSTDFNCWSSHPFTYLTPIKDPPFRAEFPRLDHNVGSTLPWGTNYDWNDRCPYPSTYFNRWTPHPFTYLTPKKGPPFRAEPIRLDHNVGSTLPPGELSTTEMTDVPTLPNTSTVGLATLSCTWSLKKVPLPGGAFPYRP